jgi:hypothetical protein
MRGTRGNCGWIIGYPEISPMPRAVLSIASFFQSTDSEGFQPRIGAEDRKVMLDGLGGDHPVEWIAVLALEARCAHHRLRLKRKKCVSEAILDVRDEVAFEIGRLGKFA